MAWKYQRLTGEDRVSREHEQAIQLGWMTRQVALAGLREWRKTVDALCLRGAGEIETLYFWYELCDFCKQKAI